jgi:hypothetical protein
MTRKLLYSVLAIIVLCICSSTCFAADNGNSVTLGNEIMQSIDKTGQSFENLTSMNIVDDTVNEVKSGVNDYNTVQTTTESTVQRSGMNTMTTTTWMWIILSVAAIIIIAAIWYYATQNNS